MHMNPAKFPDCLQDEEFFPASVEESRWSVNEIEALIQDKLLSRIKCSVTEIRDAYTLLGRPHGGMKEDEFKMCLAKYGLILRPREVHEIFTKYDKDGSGQLNFYELIHGLLPDDYPEKQWNVKRHEEIMERDPLYHIQGKSPLKIKAEARARESGWGDSRDKRRRRRRRSRKKKTRGGRLANAQPLNLPPVGTPQQQLRNIATPMPFGEK